MNSVKNDDLTDSTLSRRDFVAAAIATVGGLALFNIPSKAYAQDDAAVFDSLGTKVDTAKQIKKVVPMGIYAQTLMETLYPEALASLAKEVSVDANDFRDAGMAQVAALPETGTTQGAFGKKANASQIKQLQPDLILQTGFDSPSGKIEAERMQSETSVQTIYLDISFGNLQDAYRTLGKVLGCSDRAEQLAKYIDEIQNTATVNALSVPSENKPLRVFYGPRVLGKKVTEGVRVQIDVMRALGFDPITTPYDFDNRTIEFDLLEQENPEFIFFDDTALPSSFFSREGEAYMLWKDVGAMQSGEFAVAPALMHNVLGSAVFSQSIGMLWMAYVISPDTFRDLFISELQRFYLLFYGLERSEEDIQALLGEGA